MNNKFIEQKKIEQKISILSSDETTIKLLEMNSGIHSFSSEFLPENVIFEDLLTEPTDVLILDEQNSLEVSVIDACRLIRAKNEEVIIIILADKFDAITKVLALEFGADDYLEKPANPLEIMARIKITLKRMHDAKKEVLESGEFKFNDLYLDVNRRICVADGKELSLTNYEFLTLLQLVKSQGSPVAREALLTDIWGFSSDESTRPVDDIVRRLRKKLKAGQSPTQISTVWGYGYRIEVS